MDKTNQLKLKCELKQEITNKATSKKSLKSVFIDIIERSHYLNNWVVLVEILALRGLSKHC